MCAALVGAALVLGTGRTAQDLFDLQKVADGVYAALAKPRTPINCNAAVIVYDEGVLVVDTHSRPSSARALIQQIKGVTDKPVRYAVNSHFHWDHAQGNHAYPVAFPKQVAIVASEATRENLELGMQRVKEQIDNGPRLIDEVKRRLAAAQDAAAQAALREELRQQEEYLAEIRSLELTLPDLTFDKSLILHRPDRDVVLLFLGGGTPAATSSRTCRSNAWSPPATCCMAGCRSWATRTRRSGWRRSTRSTSSTSTTSSAVTAA